MSSTRRTPAGSPAGGQFTTSPKAESTTSLGDVTDDFAATHAAAAAARTALSHAEADLVAAWRDWRPWGRASRLREAERRLDSARKASFHANVAVTRSAGEKPTPGADVDLVRARLGRLPSRDAARAEWADAARSMDQLRLRATASPRSVFARRAPRPVRDLAVAEVRFMVAKIILSAVDSTNPD